MRPLEPVEPVVLVAERSPDAGWRTFAVTGNTVAPVRSANGEPWEGQLCAWLESVDPAPVQSVVVLTDEAEGCEFPRVLMRHPVPVLSMPKALALAPSAPKDWARFAIVDGETRCGLATTLGRGRYHYVQSARGDGIGAASGFGYRRVVSTRVIDGFEAAAMTGGSEERLRGAAEIARDALLSDGVCASRSEAGSALRLTVQDTLSYEVRHASTPVLDPGSSLIARMVGDRPVLLAVDMKVFHLYEEAIRTFAKEGIKAAGVALVRPGERAKSWSQVARVCAEAVRCKLPRHGVIVALGGGVALDVAGLAAALYRRGVDYVRVPTTLVGVVDVAVGIKLGVNYGGRKSLIGTFRPPFGVVNDLRFLATLPEEELACGLWEILKLGLVRDPLLFEWIEAHGASLMHSGFQSPPLWGERIALRAERAMMTELQQNLWEREHQRLPDFGHTFSPAFEAASGFRLRHGDAVAADMLLSTIIAENRGLCDGALLDRIVHLYRAIGFRGAPESCTPEVVTAAIHDIRSHRAGSLHLVVPTALGIGGFVEELSDGEIEDALRAMRGLWGRGSG